MSENPLLPHRRLKELYALMQRIDKLAPAPDTTDSTLGTLVAAVYLQLQSGDVLCGAWGEAILRRLSDKRTQTGLGPIVTTASQDSDLPALSEVLASGLNASKPRKVIIARVSSSACMQWATTLKRAQTERLPLILVIGEQAPVRSRSQSVPLTWPVVSQLAKKLQLPIITVDGDDVVATYRVLQESLHRARHGDGPAIIWSAHPSGPASGTMGRSLASMREYLSSRNLLPRSRQSS